MKQLEKRLKEFIVKLKYFFKQEIKYILTKLYLIGLAASVILILLYATFPALSICNDSLGFEFCVPTGIFMGLILSIPGYIIAGNILAKFENIHWFVSLLLVILTSYAFYYLFGLGIDRFKKADLRGKIKIVVVGTFLILLVLLLYLI